MSRISLVFLAGLAACADAPGTGTLAATVLDGDGDPCPKLGCSSNSAFLGPTELHELDETGVTENHEGLRIASFTRNGYSYAPDVTGTVLVARRRFGGFLIETLAGTDLVGSRMVIAQDGVPTYELAITKVTQSQLYWQPPIVPVETYELKWKYYRVAMHHEPVCKDPPDRIDGEGKEWNNISEAILFTGDRYDADTLEVIATDPASAGPWFNIGCAGTVLAKLVLNRHTHASQTSAWPTTWSQRQTMLKMYTSDVCNTGDAFTVQGTPIRWFAANGWSSPAGAFPTHEALWNHDGAVCLQTHRLNNTVDDMDSQIQAACGVDLPPPCSSYPGYPNLAPGGPYLRTMNAAIPD